MRRVISRGTPAELTKAEQEDLVRLLDAYPALRDAIEVALGRKLDSLTFGEKVIAVHNHQEMGRGLTAMNAATRAIRDAQNLASDIRGEVSLADKLATAEAQISLLREQKAAAEAEAARQKALRVSDDAQEAMAVYADQPAPPKRTRKARTVAA